MTKHKADLSFYTVNCRLGKFAVSKTAVRKNDSCVNNNKNRRLKGVFLFRNPSQIFTLETKIIPPLASHDEKKNLTDQIHPFF